MYGTGTGRCTVFFLWIYGTVRRYGIFGRGCKVDVWYLRKTAVAIPVNVLSTQMTVILQCVE